LHPLSPFHALFRRRLAPFHFAVTNERATLITHKIQLIKMVSSTNGTTHAPTVSGETARAQNVGIKAMDIYFPKKVLFNSNEGIFIVKVDILD
jgi:hypothetical protein